MSIRALDDGRILLHDFGGDAVEAILAAIGLTFSDLFPPRAIGHHVGERRPFPAEDILRAIGFEVLVVGVAAATVAAGEPLAVADRERLRLAVSRIQSALDAGGLNG